MAIDPPLVVDVLEEELGTCDICDEERIEKILQGPVVALWYDCGTLLKLCGACQTRQENYYQRGEKLIEYHIIEPAKFTDLDMEIIQYQAEAAEQALRIEKLEELVCKLYPLLPGPRGREVGFKLGQIAFMVEVVERNANATDE